MKINQLFIEQVPVDLINKMLNCIPLDSLNDKQFFTKYTLITNKTVEKFETEVIDKLFPYYLPCKSKIYLTNMNEKKFITILKQCIKLYGYKILSIEKNKCNKKQIYYTITNSTNLPTIKNARFDSESKLLRFE